MDSVLVGQVLEDVSVISVKITSGEIQMKNAMLVIATLMDLPHYSVIKTMAVVCVWWGLVERSVISVLEATLGLLPTVHRVENALITGIEY